MKIVGIVFGSIAALVLLLAVSVGLGLFGLEWQKFFSPRRQNIQRQVFEETQSYVHGKTQDLAKYYEEYIHANNQEDREAIRQIIIMRFSEFDTNKLQSQSLRNFLIQQRGY